MSSESRLKKKPKLKTISTKVDEELLARVKVAVDENGITLRAVIEFGFEQYLKMEREK